MFDVNCIIPMYNVGSYIQDALASLRSQTISFSKIQVILVDDGSTDNTGEVCRSIIELGNIQGNNNIVYLTQEHGGTPSALNRGLAWLQENAEGAFTCFLDADDKYEKSFMEKATKYLSTRDINMAFCCERNFERGTNLWPQYSQISKTHTRAWDIANEVMLIRNICCGMFRTSYIVDKRFNVENLYAYGFEFLMSLCLEQSKVGYIDGTSYLKRKRVANNSLGQTAFGDPEFYKIYANTFRKTYEAFLDSDGVHDHQIPMAVQNSVIYEITRLRNQYVDNVASEEVLEQASRAIEWILSVTRNEILEQGYIPYWFKQYFLTIKYGSPWLNENEVIPRFYYGGYRSSELVEGSVSVMQTHEKNGVLNLRGFFIKPDYAGIRLVASVDDVLHEAETHYTYTNDRKCYLDHEVMQAMDFSFRIPLDLKDRHFIRFYFKTPSGKLFAANMRYEASSRFANENNFFVGDRFIIKLTTTNNILRADKIDQYQIYEYVANRNNIGDNSLYESYIKNYEQFSKRRIWLFMDRRTNIDDNGEALFRYANNVDDGIEKFFVVPDASYLQQFEGVGWTVIWNSFEFKLLLLFAEKFISSHTFEVGTTVWFDKQAEITLRNFVNRFSNVDFVFLQHGITKENVSSWLNTYRHDLSLLITAAKGEEEEFLKDYYGYGPDIVKLTGFPRYDRLVSHPEKAILFMPTFFKPFTTFRYTYNKDFKQSAYFHAMNGLLNDSRLVEALGSRGYKLYFKLHEELIIQQNDFHIPPEIQLISKEMSFNKLFDISSVMITDYTSAVFDFAYLKKPIIYYQAVENIKYPDGYFSYEDNGFGDVTKTQQETITKLIYYIENGCKMEEKYIRRVDEFFAFTDRNNCQRVYSGILAIQRQKSFLECAELTEEEQ